MEWDAMQYQPFKSIAAQVLHRISIRLQCLKSDINGLDGYKNIKGKLHFKPYSLGVLTN